MSKIIGIAGSARKRGNSTTLMRSALKAAEAKGFETKEIYLNGLNFKGCQGCPKCSPKGKCILNDDLAPVMEELRGAEGWILASPIYFDSISGQLKTFFDRCHTFIIDPKTQDLKPQLDGKRTGMVVLAYEDNPRKEYHYEGEKLANYLRWMGDFKEIEIISEANMSQRNSAKNNPDMLAKIERRSEALFR